MPDQELNIKHSFLFLHVEQNKIMSDTKKQTKNKNIATCHRLLMTLTGLCFTAGFLSAGFLAASDTFFTVKGTPYLLAGLVIFCAGASGMEPGAERLASHTSRMYIKTFQFHSKSVFNSKDNVQCKHINMYFLLGLLTVSTV